MLGKVGGRWGVKLARIGTCRIARLAKRMHGDLSCVALMVGRGSENLFLCNIDLICVTMSHSSAGRVYELMRLLAIPFAPFITDLLTAFLTILLPRQGTGLADPHNILIVWNLFTTRARVYS